MAEQWRILVVEGEENLNWNIVNSLQKDGYSVLGVTGGAEAIRTLWSEEYDVVICSQQMPDADGFDLLQWMRTYCPDARMVMLGQAGGGVNRTQALEMGVASYLEKPLDMHALKEELRRLFHQTGFSASLDSFDLLDVIQIITMSRKSIALVVSTGLEEQGVLRFQMGELIWAEYGTLRGEEAFFALAAHKNGTVVHRPWNDQITPNVMQPLSRLIFQALQYRSKYAEYQQMSSELEAVKPGNGTAAPVPDFSAPLSSNTFGSALDAFEEDDTPFQFVAEDFSGEGTRKEEPYEQVWSNNATNGRMEQVGGGATSLNGVGAGEEEKKAWWQPTGAFPALQSSASTSAVTDGEPGKVLPRNGSVNITPSTVHKTGVGQGSGLPSWLTDQPTNLDLPVLRGNTGQMPALPPQERSPVLPRTPSTSLPASSMPLFATGQMPALPPQERSPVLPKTPPTGGIPASPLPSFMPASAQQAPNVPNVSAEWPVVSRPASINPADSGLRKINPEESMFTTPHRAVRSNGPAPVEWQAPPSGPLSAPSGPLDSVRAPGYPERRGDTLQSLAALKYAAGPHPTPSAPLASPTSGNAPGSVPPSGIGSLPASSLADVRGSLNGAGQLGREIGEAVRPDAMGNAGKRNYPALAAALQTIGYSVVGFVASAIVGLDGSPIAQVAVDDTDISPLCAYLCTIVQGAARVIEPERNGDCEYIVITSRTQHILLRVLSRKKDVFQVLITTHETMPAESLDVLANVESALAAAL